MQDNTGLDATQERPDEIDGQEDPRNENLPKQIVNAIKAALKKITHQDMYDRRREVLHDRRLRYYSRGFQHIYEHKSSGVFALGVKGGIISLGDRDIQCPNFIDDYNIFFPYQRALSAILCQNPPGIDFRPKNPALAEDNEASETAEGYKEYYNQSNSAPTLQQEMVRMFMLSGRCVAWTRTEASQAKWGLNDQGEARQMETTNIYGTLESHVSIMAKCAEDSPYCILLDDVDILQGKAEYPEKRDDIKAGAASILENEYERIARLGILHGTRMQSQIGDAMTHLVTRGHCFLRPCFFEGEEFDETMEEGDGEQTLRDVCQELYPSGCHFVLVGDTYVGSWDECPDDVLTISFPYDGDGMFRMAVMDPMVVLQDAFNDYKNAEREIFTYGWPSRWINTEAMDWDAVADQRADPYAIREVKAPTNVALGNAFFQEPDPELPASFIEAQQEMRGALAQFMSGAQPSLYGAAKNKTASEAALDRSQSMGMLSLPWARIQWMWSRIYYQAAIAAGKNPDHAQEIVVPGSGGQGITLQLEKLTKGNFGVFPDEDSAFPESTEAKRALLQELVKLAGSSPIGQAIFNSPENWKQINTVMGYSELVIPQAEARDKQARELQLLLEQPPIPPAPQDLQIFLQQHAQATLLAQAGGGPMPPRLPNLQPQIGPDGQMTNPMEDINVLQQLAALGLLKPSIQPGPLDFDAFEGEYLKEWMSSIHCWREMANGKAVNILNVQLHAQAHLANAAQQAAAAAASKPPSESINFKDESPAGQEQMNAQAGIKIAPGQAPAPHQIPKAKPPGAGHGQPSV